MGGKTQINARIVGGKDYQVKSRGSSKLLRTLTTTFQLVVTLTMGPGNLSFTAITCINKQLKIKSFKKKKNPKKFKTTVNWQWDVTLSQKTSPTHKPSLPKKSKKPKKINFFPHWNHCTADLTNRNVKEIIIRIFFSFFAPVARRREEQRSCTGRSSRSKHTDLRPTQALPPPPPAKPPAPPRPSSNADKNRSLKHFFSLSLEEKNKDFNRFLSLKISLTLSSWREWKASSFQD